MGSAPGLTFPSETFAKLTPAPYLHAHLKQSPPLRANGRKPSDFRYPTINTGSLTHSNGSAVVRLGDTAIVCGVRGEILLASDIPRHPSSSSSTKASGNEDEEVDEEEGKALIEDLGLLISNLELSTGCSPAHLPGNPPGTLAQTLSHRLSSLLNDSGLVSLSDLRILYSEPEFAEGEEETELQSRRAKLVTKAYWALYIDVWCISLDGNAFDAAWLGILAALKNTVLPKAWWDADAEGIFCSPLLEDAKRLKIKEVPVAATFTVFTTASPLKKGEEAEAWVLADPDGFEEEVCRESLTVVVVLGAGGKSRVIRLEKGGGAYVGRGMMEECIAAAETRAKQIMKVLGQD